MKLSHILKPNMKAAFYGRHSTDKQDMDMQMNSVMEVIRKYDCIHTHSFLDKAVSARKNKLTSRKELENMFETAKRQEFDFVIVYKSDRLARDPLEHQTIRIVMKTLGIPIIISSTEGVYNTDNDLIVKLMEDGFTKYEVDTIIARTRSGLENKAKQGKWLGGKPPFGYTYDKNSGHFIEYPEELGYVKEIFSLYLKGHGFQYIANTFPKGSRRGKGWGKENIKAIVLNPFYCGLISWRRQTDGKLNARDIWIEAPNHYVKPIIPRNTWEACWRIYSEKRSGNMVPKHYKTSFLLQGLLSCEKCHALMRTKNQQTVSSTNKKYGGKIYFCSNCKVRVDADLLHDKVVNQTLTDVKVSGFHNVYRAIEKKIQHEIKELNHNIQKHQQLYENYTIKLQNITEELKQRMKNNDDKRLLKSLAIYRLDVQRKLDTITQQINEFKKQITLKEKVEKSKETWLHTLNEVFQDDVKLQEISDMDKRRFLLPLIQSVSVKENKKRNEYDISLQLRTDFSKRDVKNQISLIL
ncbi:MULTISPECIES: recombinase family protein [Bacillus]|uniref:Recombinase RecB n=2 Tax=Bacillus pseudomycoides TaxID=64104 RepID=A0A1Y3MHP3_9BACI|nr:recombinase family protein [Bacillus pseudomycoides]OUM47950.1 recombinase RecB [Bacillus pseudomycoides]